MIGFKKRERPAIFIVGASGYLGTTLFHFANKVRCAFGTSTSGENELLLLRLNEPADFDYFNIFPNDIVMVTAAISEPDICSNEYERAWNVNVTGTSIFIQNVIDRGARVIFFSSDTVYGEQFEPFDEKAACNAVGEYAEMKLAVEQRFSGEILFKTIRLSYVFSREDRFSSYLIQCADQGEVASLFHPFLRSIVHRGDVVEGAIALADRWDEIPEQFINFGGPHVLSRIEFAEALQGACIPELRFKVDEPDKGFFKNRPRAIAMTSPIFADLLGRLPRSLTEAALLEFSLTLND